jgi:hypothetical protein
MSGARWRGRTPPNYIESARSRIGFAPAACHPFRTAVWCLWRDVPARKHIPAWACPVLLSNSSKHEVTIDMETAQSEAMDALHEHYVAARRAYKEAERKFSAMVAGFFLFSLFLYASPLLLLTSLPSLFSISHRIQLGGVARGDPLPFIVRYAGEVFVYSAL